MNLTPLVSYVMAAYNHEKYIGQAIQDIRAQDHHNIELIVIDDGSPDQTYETARMAAADDPRISIARQENRGIVATRNSGLTRARGDFVSFIDSDDRFATDRTSRLVKTLLADDKIVLAYGDAWIIDSDNKRIGRFHAMYPPKGGNFSLALFENYCFVPACSVMVRKRSLLSTGPLWGPGACTDYLKWIELGLVGKTGRLDGTPLSSWRFHSTNLSRASVVNRMKSYDELADGLAELVDRHPEFSKQLPKLALQRRRARCFLLSAFHLICEGEWDRAESQLSKSLVENKTVATTITRWICRSPMHSFLRALCLTLRTVFLPSEMLGRLPKKPLRNDNNS